MVFYKKHVDKPRVGYDEAVEEALCFGWIDSRPGKLDDDLSMLWFSPRRPRSAWSRSNKERVARLIADKRMHPAGLAKIEAARKDGSWETLEGPESLAIPPDLRKELAAHAGAIANFDAFPPGVKKGILSWIASAKKPETRATRIAETARLAALNIRANQWQPAHSAPAPARKPRAATPRKRSR